jgi:hypothetical protein
MVTKMLRAAVRRNAAFEQGLRRRLPRRDDETGSLMFALLLMFVASSLAAIMLPVLLSALTGTQNDIQRTVSGVSAQAGIDVAMAQIRAANDGSGNGVLSLLPCGILTGPVSGANNARYSVTVSYYKADPRGQTAQWLHDNAIQCLPGAGARSAPSYGLLVSQGTDQATGAFTSGNSRSIQATYLFQSNNANISGGLIHVFKTSTSKDLCIDAGAGSPVAGTSATMQLCTAGSSNQLFSYNKNLTLTLVGSINAGQPLGMCLDAGTPETANLTLKLQPCGTTTLPQQQWSFNDSANFVGTDDGVNLNSYCFNVQSPNIPGSLIVLSTSCNGGYDNIESWSPDAAVGAGAAGASSGQLVNFNQFGRCMDITEQNVSYGYIIDWPCKQKPDASTLTWNQRYTLPVAAAGASSATGRITTNPSSTVYCLTSPGSTSSGQYVTVTPCPGNTPTNMTWTVYTKTSTYATSYEITDGYGYCLQPTDPTLTPPDLYPQGNNISKLIVQTCNGSTLQKWNAPANLVSPLPLKDVGEK